jgi:hypothetical protein
MMKTKRVATQYCVYARRGGLLHGLNESVLLFEFCELQLYKPANIYVLPPNDATALSGPGHPRYRGFTITLT